MKHENMLLNKHIEQREKDLIAKLFHKLLHKNFYSASSCYGFYNLFTHLLYTQDFSIITSKVRITED